MWYLVRCFLIAFMVVLLPLRSWAGDAMATKMASSAVSIAIETGAASAHNANATTLFDAKKQVLDSARAASDCHEQGLIQQTAQGNVDKAGASAGHCGTCVACQVCHTVALLSVLPGVAIAFTSPQLRQTSSAMFTSADAALGQKPPIA